MFDKFYQVSILADRPGFANPEEELYQINGISVRLKHWASFLAINNEEANFEIQTYEYKEILRKFLVAMQESGEELIQVLETGFVVLMERVVAQN